MIKRLLKLSLALLLLSPLLIAGLYWFLCLDLDVRHLTGCQSNLIELQKAVLAYREEHGALPKTLNEVIEKLPGRIACPQLDADTYSPGYVITKDDKDFTICCKGPAHHHLSADDLPRIDSSGKIDRGKDVPWHIRTYVPLP